MPCVVYLSLSYYRYTCNTHLVLMPPQLMLKRNKTPGHFRPIPRHSQRGSVNKRSACRKPSNFQIYILFMDYTPTRLQCWAWLEILVQGKMPTCRIVNILIVPQAWLHQYYHRLYSQGNGVGNSTVNAYTPCCNGSN